MKWQGFYLTGDNMNELLVPAGFGHGYLVIEDSIVSYKCSEKFYGDSNGRYNHLMIRLKTANQSKQE